MNFNRNFFSISKSLMFSLVFFVTYFSSPAFAFEYYGGGKLGKDADLVHYDRTVSEEPSLFISENFGLAGFNYGGFLGIQFSLGSFYALGIEAFLDKSNATGHYYYTDGGAPSTFEYQHHATAGLDFLPSYLVNSENRLFLKVGLAYFKVKRSLTGEAEESGPAFDSNLSGTSAGLHPGGFGSQLGFGYEVLLQPYLSLRAEWTHTSFLKSKEEIGTGEEAGYSWHYQPKGDQASLAVVIHEVHAKEMNSFFEPLRHVFYAGVDLGRDMSRYKFLYLDSADANFLNQIAFGLSGSLLGVGLGYRAEMGRVSLGGELSGDVSNSKLEYRSDPNVSNGNYDYKQGGSYGVSILPGFWVNPKGIMYLRLGYIYTNYKKTGDQILGYNFSNRRRGNLLGGGYEVLYGENMSLYGEYTYAHYRKILTHGDINSTTTSYDYHPASSRFLLGLRYRI